MMISSTNFVKLKTINYIGIKNKGLIFTSLVLIFTLLSIFSTHAQNPFIPKYDAVKRSERCFTVTWEANNQFGAVWWADKVDFSQDTAFNFVVYMGDRDGNGADGLAFVMHQDSRDTITDPGQQVIIGGAGTWDLQAATGDDGGGLGFAMHQSRVGPNTIPGPHGPGDDPENHKIQTSVAVELDTWNNRDVPDGKNGTDTNGNAQVTSPYYGWDHTSVVYNGDIYGGQQVITDANGDSDRILPLKPAYAFGNGNNPDGSVHHNIEDDRCYLFQIRWEVDPVTGEQTIQLWADVYNGTTNIDGLQMVMTHSDDMINNVFGGDPVMRFGFTGSTGGAINEQTICLLGENLKPFAQDDYASIPMNTTAIIDVESNDNDPDGDQLHVPIIIENARHGSATIFDSLDVNYMRYTPNTGYVGLDTIGYVTCDVNSTKCYAKCDTAYVFIDVGCIPFDVDLTAISPNLVCTDSVPANGSAQANVDATFIRGTVWYEGFEDLPSRTTVDNGPSGWSTYESGSDCKPGNNIYTQNFEFRIKVVTNGDCEIVFETDEIDISNIQDVDISIDIKTSNADYESDDYVETYYILDGGPETMFDVNGHLDGTFGIKTASTSGLNGSTLKIVVRAKADHSDEEYYWDNIHVTAIGAGVPDVTYNWYEGPSPSGSIIYTGAVNNNLHSGMYTVIAIDNLTGCPSNPATITIDSAGIKVPGGFIEQLSPFTNCELPYDGSLGAGVIDGTDTLTNGYNFDWYYQEDPKTSSFIQRTGAIAQNLDSREYTVIITEIATGCDTALNAEVLNEVTIPTVTATKLADITSCINPNSGIGSANVGGVTNGYRFEWYNGPAIGGGPEDFLGSTVNTFPEGTFTVQAIDSVTSCPSDPATITIEDLTDTPVLDVDIVNELTSCDPLAPNGQLSGTVDESGTPTTSGYVFNWYRGQNDLPANLVHTGSTAGGLDIGTYRLVVVEDGTNCTSYVDTLISDVTVTPPGITLAATDVTSCAVPNGTITATVVGNPSDYLYDLYKGAGAVVDSLLTTSNSNIFTDLSIGNYTVVAKDIISKCETNPVTISINDARIGPDATLTTQNQTSCDPASFTGSVTISMGFADINDFTYDWFEADFTTPIPGSGSAGELISGLDSGDYVVRVTDNFTQCENVYYPTVNIGIVLPIDSVGSVPSTYCAPNGNGELRGFVLGTSNPITDYTFIWESVATGATLPNNTDVVSGVEPGDFILTIRDNNTACLSNPAPITVDDNTVIPIPTLLVTDNSSCDVTNPNGEIEVTGTNEDPTLVLGLYDYEWFDNATGTQQGSTSEIVSSLSSSTYELRILNTTTSCSNSILSLINDINIKPLIDGVTVIDATDCSDPYMSGASVTTVDGGMAIPAGYTFEWTNLDGGPTIASQLSSISDNTIGNEILPPGNYQVIAYNEFNCPSDPITFEIRDLSVDPVFTMDATPNTSCAIDPNVYANGSLTVNYTGPNTITDYNWERELPAGSGNWIPFGGNNIMEVELNELNNYRVEIIDDHKCRSINYANINKVTDPNPVIDFGPVSDVEDCATPDGELEAQIILGAAPPVGYNFEYILTGPVNTSQFDNGLFQNLSEGNYQVVVVNTFTQCQSNQIDTAINISTDLQFTISPTAPADCSGSLGEIAISGQSNSGLNEPPATGPGFNYNWFAGNDKSTPVNAADISSPDSWSSLATQLVSNNYTIEITDLSTSCSIDTTIFLPTSSVPTFISAITTNSTQCDPGNGEVELTIDPTTFGLITVPPDYAGYADYEYILFKGNAFDPLWLVPGDGEYKYFPAGSFAVAPVTFTDLEPGTYTVVAKESTFGSGCFSNPVTFTIGLDFTFDPLSFNEIRPDNTCATPVGNGQLEETNAFYLTGGKFEYTWYKGTDTSIAANIVTGPTFATKITEDTLRAGQYTLFVEIKGANPTIGLGCVTSGVTNLSKEINKLLIESAPANPKTICSYGNGDIHIANISEDGAPIGSTAGYGNFMLYDTNFTDIGTTDTGDGTFGTPWDSLDVGAYYVTAQNATTLCITDPFKVDIQDISINPVIAVSVISPDYSCNAVSPTGILDAQANGIQDVALYSYEWRDPSNASVSDAPNTFTASGLSANNSGITYTITVEDISLDMVNDGCVSTRAITLVHQPTTTSILSNNVVSTDQTWCSPNGEIQITGIRETVGLVNTDYIAPFTNPPLPFDFDVNLLDNNLGSLSAYFVFDPLSGSIVDNLGHQDSIPAGTYYVQAQNITNGCSYGPLTQVIIKDLSKNPIISATLDNPDYVCFTADPGNLNHTGQLTAIFEGGSDGDDLATNFSTTWTVKATGIVTAGGNTAINLWPDVYTLQVIDNSDVDQGCISTRDYIVPNARHDIDVFGSGTDQTICIPDGVIQIDSILVDNVKVAAPLNNWTGFLLSETNTPLANTGAGLASDPFGNLTANSYYIKAQDNSTECFSNTYQVILDDVSTDPIITDINVDNPQYSLNPNPLSWTGILTASVSEADGSFNFGDYDFDWYEGLGTSNTLNQHLLTMDSLDKGMYTLVAHNNNTNCETSFYTYLPYEYLEPTFNTLISPQTVCLPYDGGIQVTDIDLDAIPDDLVDYDFFFHQDDYVAGDTPDQTIPGDNTYTVYDDINAGAYYIIAKENWWWVESYPVKVDVIDSTTNPIITFDATNYHAVTSCDESVYADGALEIEVFEEDNPFIPPGQQSYNYTWIDEEQGSVIQGEVNPFISGLKSGDYTVIVVNQYNNCQAEKTYTIEDMSNTPIVVAAQTPNTNCPIEIANGIVSANVINTTNNYNYLWFEGNEERPAPNYQGAIWDSRPVGYYTVVAVDQDLTTCISSPVVIMVEDATVHPTVLINEISPVTNCDPTRANGVLSAVTEAGIDGHTFEWFINGELNSTGPIANNLGLYEYQLLVTNNVTQCETTLSSGPTELLAVVPPPNVDILNDRTSCLEPDGMATASISGNVVDYIFAYFNKYSGVELNNYVDDYVIHDLDTSTYLVTAEDRTTGCISDPTEFAIANETYFPEIDVIADPSNCQEPSGSANVIISDLTREYKVTWYGENGYEAQEKEIVYIPVGKYLVEVEGTDGCISSTEAEVKGDILIYNGVSANYDGMNDFFQVICLEYFIENNVKIFNRAGMLVYEQDFYDMNDPAKRFEGISNKGASIIGTELPIGTYFYVVDKNDGSKAKVGYLELNR